MSYSFLDASGSVMTGSASVIAGEQYQRVFVNGVVSVSGAFTPSGNQSVSGTVGASVVGTVPTTQAGQRITSVAGTVTVASLVGTYSEDAASGNSDPGLFGLKVRNDTMSSITSTDGDYSGSAVGPVGETLTANAPMTKWVQGVASAFTGVIQPVIPAQGTSIFTYITSGQAANASANNVYLTLYGAASSIIGFLPVPANSGALPLMINGMKTSANGAFSASVSGVSSVFLSFQGFISKT